jgi:hypothetical protein
MKEVESIGEDDDYWITVHFYTERYRYHIVAVNHSNTGKTYLGCQVGNRTPRPGEDWTRGSDMYDGVFSWKTWAKIKNDIIRNEMKAISKYILSDRYDKEL